MDRSNIESIYPLPPVGEALLLRRIQSAPADPGLLHVAVHLVGEVDDRALSEAWQLVSDRHEALRSSVHWKKSRHTMQVVGKRVEASFCHQQGTAADLDQFKKNDWARGVDVTTAPIDRLALLSKSPSEHTLLWTTHHLLLDGWSAAIILEELLSCYAAIRRGAVPRLAPVPSKGPYASWLTGRDSDAAETFWTGYLKGFSRPLDVAPRQQLGPSTFPFPARTIEFSDQEQQHIAQLVNTTECTLGQILQIGLAVCLSRITSEDDVVFGMTASGRPAEVPHVDRMTGLFTSTLPVRLTLDRSLTVRETALKLRARQAEMTRYGFLSPERIHDVSDIQAGQTLYDCILIVENFPWREFFKVEDVGFAISEFKGTLTTTLPLTVTAADVDGLDLHVLYDPGLLTEKDADWFAGILKDALVATTVNAETQIGDVLHSVNVPVRETEPGNGPKDEPDQHGPREPASPPIDDIELSLARIWSEVLGIKPISRNDDFFELGGRSLQAVQVFNRIERQLGEKLPLSAIFEGRTIAGMASVIRGDEKPAAWKSLVPIQPFGSRPPIFCVHAVEGHVNFYFDLAKRLGPDQPVYGIQAVGLNGGKPLKSVQAMAELYAAEVFSIQKDAPCIVAGLCFGTTISIELVDQINALGGDVRLLIALDTGPIDPRPGTDGVPAPIMNRILKPWRRAGRRLERTQTRMFGTQRQKWHSEVVRANVEAVSSYVTRAVQTPVLFIRSTEFARRENKARHLERWNEIAINGLEVAEVEVEHDTMMAEPEVGLVAEMISRYIERLDEQQS